MNKKLTLVFILILLILSTYVLYLNFFSKDKMSVVNELCTQKYNEIQKLLDDANYCEEDSDCKIENFGCPFDCYSLVNKDSDVSFLRSLTSKYNSDCYFCKYQCNPDPTIISCKNKKCVANYDSN